MAKKGGTKKKTGPGNGSSAEGKGDGGDILSSPQIEDFGAVPLVKHGSREAQLHKSKLGMVGEGQGRASAAAAFGVSPKKGAIHPGKERWSVKTGTDADRDLVNLKKRVEATVEELVRMPRPHDMTPPEHSFSGYDNHRATGVETTVWTVEAEIYAYKEEDDGDYHLAIQGDKALTMIAEAPNPQPNFVSPKSPFATAVAAARKVLDKELKPAPTREYQKTRRRVQITGVGFFDRVHGQLGHAPSGVELHPILHIKFLD
jgi:hypothetical protein